MDSLNHIQWRQRPMDEMQLTQLVIDLDIHRLLARVLLGRGMGEVESVKKFLKPQLAHLKDPALFQDMEVAADRLIFALAQGELIGIFADYDVDGVSSAVVLSEFIEQVGGKHHIVIPDRLKDGYGLSINGVQAVFDAGARLLVSVDCGVSAHEPIAFARTLGIDVIVLDHHTVPATLPDALAVVNPLRSDCKSEAPYLCAVGIVFYLCAQLRRSLRKKNFFRLKPEPDLKRSLDLVALGTVADVAPLIGDNRIFVSQGLLRVARGERPGLSALLEVANLDPQQITAGNLGFHLGPRINAAGRLDDAMNAVNLLKTTDYWLARCIAQKLDGHNQERKSVEENMLQQAIQQIDRSIEFSKGPVMVVEDENWHPGVVGIVAARLCEKYGRPALVIGQNGRGSGRSIPCFHLYDALCAIQDNIKGFGGHAHAVGVHLAPGQLGAFREALSTYAGKKLAGEDLSRRMDYDGEIGVVDMNPVVMASLETVGPFGRGNPEIVFRLNGIRLQDVRELKGGHVRGVIRGDPLISFIGFGMRDKQALFDGPVDVLGVPETNHWQGQKSLQLRLKDVQRAS